MRGPLWIASSELLGVQPDGTHVHVVARLGSPCRRSDGTWVSAYVIEGLTEPHDMVGVDSLQALSMAMSMVRALLERFVEQGGRVLDREALTDFPLEATFGLVSAGRAPATPLHF